MVITIKCWMKNINVTNGLFLILYYIFSCSFFLFRIQLQILLDQWSTKILSSPSSMSSFLFFFFFVERDKRQKACLALIGSKMKDRQNKKQVQSLGESFFSLVIITISLYQIHLRIYKYILEHSLSANIKSYYIYQSQFYYNLILICICKELNSHSHKGMMIKEGRDTPRPNIK